MEFKLTDGFFGWLDELSQRRNARAEARKVQAQNETRKTRADSLRGHEDSIINALPQGIDTTDPAAAGTVIATVINPGNTLDGMTGKDVDTKRNEREAEVEGNTVEAKRRFARVLPLAVRAHARLVNRLARPSGYFRAPGPFFNAPGLARYLLFGNIVLDAALVTNFIANVMGRTPFGLLLTLPMAALVAAFGTMPLYFAGRLAREATNAVQASGKGAGAAGTWVGAIGLGMFGMLVQVAMFLVRSGLDTGSTSAKGSYAGFSMLSLLLAASLTIVEYLTHDPKHADQVVCADTDKGLETEAEALHKYIATVDALTVRNGRIEDLQKTVNAKKAGHGALAKHDPVLWTQNEVEIKQLEAEIEKLRATRVEYTPLDWEALMNTYLTPVVTDADQPRLFGLGDDTAAA